MVKKKINVTFYEGYGKYAEEIAVVELTLDPDGKASINASDIPSGSLPWLGYEKKNYMPAYYDGYDDKYEVEPDYWYMDNGEFKLFDETVSLTENTNVYWMYREISVNALGVAVVVRYNEDAKMLDSVKSFLDKAIPLLQTAKEAGEANYEELTSTMLGILESADLIDEDKFIKTIKSSLAYVNALEESDVQSVNNIINVDGEFEVIAGNLELLKKICNELKTITFDKVLAENSESDISVMIPLAGYDACESIFESIRNGYCEKLEALITDVEKGTVSGGLIPATLTMIFDPVEDILMPIFNEAEEKVISEFEESIRYSENSYLQYVTEDIDVFAELLTKVDNGTDNRTGYRLKDLITCLKYIMKLIIATDDAVCWYEGYDDVTKEAAFGAALSKIRMGYSMISDRLSEVDANDNIPSAIEFTLESFQMISDIFESAIRILGDEETIQSEFKTFIDSGKLDDFKNGSIGQNVKTEDIDDIVSIIENIAENGIDTYRVETSKETDIDKYSVDIGGRTFSVSRYFIF